MQSVQSALQEIFSKLYNLHPTFEITAAPKPEFGEFCINVFPFTKVLSKAPNEISEEVARELENFSESIKKATATGGYVNFFLTDAYWQEIFNNIVSAEKPASKNETVVVDYIGMNVGKPPHIGHICTPLLGQAIINTLRYAGYTVIGDSHLGDWGSLFGKLIVGFQKYGNAQKLQDDAISHLLEVYVAINADIETDKSVEQACRDAFKKLSEGDAEYVKIWADFTTATISTNKKILKLMHIHQDFDIGESFYEGLNLPKIGTHPDLQYDMNSIVEELLEKKIATQNDDGSVGVIFPEETKMPSTILRKKDGTNLYLTSDLATIKYRMTNGWNPTKILYFVDVRQSLHLKQVFWVAKHAWNIDHVELFHAANGAIVLPEGAMSTRKGNIIRLDALVEEGFSRVKKVLEEKGRTGENSLSDKDITEITIGAIKYSYLSQDRERDVVFTWDKALNFEGNSGPYIQYAYVRAKKIGQNVDLPTFEKNPNLELSANDKLLIAKIREFPKKVNETLAKYKPHILANYAYDVAVAFNSFYVHTPKILEEKNENLKFFRLHLVAKTAEILKKTFELLGIEMPSEM